MKPAKLVVRASTEAKWGELEPHVSYIVEAALIGEPNFKIVETNVGMILEGNVRTCEFIYDMIRLHMLSLTLTLEVSYDA